MMRVLFSMLLLVGFAVSAAEPTQVFTDDLNRKVVVPVHPKRIVSLHDLDITIPLIELGVPPVASHGRTRPDGSHFLRSSGMLTGVDFDNSDIKFIGTADIDIEAIAAAKPDLIVTEPTRNTPVEQLAKIAPTVSIDHLDGGAPEIYRKLAQLTGTQARLKVLERRYQEQIKALKATIDTRKITVSVIQANQGKINAMHSYHSLGRVLRDKRFVTYVLTLTGYYMLAVQVMLMLPIMVNDIAGTPAAVKWMYAIEACLSLTLLYPIARWSERRFRLEHRLMAGLFLMTLSMMPIGLVNTLQQLFTLICTFYIGSIIAEPARETLSASLADARARGSYMGFSRLGLALGGALGYAGGGWLFDMGKALAQPELPWMMLGIIGFITFLALGWQFSHKRTPRRMLEPGA